MLIKLDSRYSEDQKEYLSECSFLDPRLKKDFHIDMVAFTDRVKDIVLSYTEIIHATEDQSLENIENESFAHTRRDKPISTISTSKSNNTDYDLFTDDQSDDDTEITDSSEIINKINDEIQRYKTIKMNKEKKNTKTYFLVEGKKRRIHFSI